MNESTGPTRPDREQDHLAGESTRQRYPRLPKPVRKPANTRSSDRDAWRGDSDQHVDGYSWFHRQMLLIIGGVALMCGVVSLATLGTDAPGGWDLASRLLSTALVATALILCVLAFRRRSPQRGQLGYTLLAIAALVAGVAVLGLFAWATA